MYFHLLKLLLLQVFSILHDWKNGPPMRVSAFSGATISHIYRTHLQHLDMYDREDHESFMEAMVSLFDGAEYADSLVFGYQN